MQGNSQIKADYQSKVEVKGQFCSLFVSNQRRISKLCGCD